MQMIIHFTGSGAEVESVWINEGFCCECTGRNINDTKKTMTGSNDHVITSLITN